MYIESLTLDNFRCFRAGRLDLWHPGRTGLPDLDTPPRLANVNVLLGLNGSGKSSALRAIALAILAPVIASSGYAPFSLIRRAPRVTTARVSAALTLHAQDGAQVDTDEGLLAVTEITRRGSIEIIRGIGTESGVWEGVFHDESPAFFLVGYGATRRVEVGATIADLQSARKARQLRYQRVASLFEDHFALTPLTVWLPMLRTTNPGRYRQVLTLINRLLPKAISFQGKIAEGDYLFRHRGIDVPFAAVSDGYKAYIGWIGDLLNQLVLGCPSGKKLTASQGVVLVDEIDLHIHPNWQLEIVPQIARALPNIQFVFTTHSPIIVGSLEHANIYTMSEHGRTDTAIERLSGEVFGLNADQVLRSSAFGLEFSRAPGFVKELQVLSARATRGEPEAAIELMRAVALGQAPVGPEVEPTPAWLLAPARGRGNTKPPAQPKASRAAQPRAGPAANPKPEPAAKAKQQATKSKTKQAAQSKANQAAQSNAKPPARRPAKSGPGRSRARK